MLPPQVNERLLFGTAGIPLSSRAPSTEAGIERIKELGLGCMEIEFVQGVRMRAATAEEVGKVAAHTGIKLSAHGPYWINFNSHEPDKLAASRLRLLQTARIGALCGVTNAIFHPAFYQGDPRDVVYERVKENVQEVLTTLRGEGNKVVLRPEVMGKPTQFGDLEEIIRLSAELDDGVGPCLDFAHMHARTGKNNSYEEFVAILDRIKRRLGPQAIEAIQIHVSGIEYTAKGEKRHIPLKESDFKFREFVRALKDMKAKGMVICESPNLEEDALTLQGAYHALK